MPITASPFYYNPQMGQIASNLATAIYGDPEARMKGAYYNSEVERNNALTGKATAETHRLNTGNQQFDALPQIQQDLAPQPGESPIQYAIRTAPARGRFMQAYPSSNIKEAQDANTGSISDIFAMGNPDEKRTSLVMQGKMPGKDFSGSRAESDQIEARDAGQDRQTKFGVANIDKSGKVAVANIDQAGANSRNAATVAGENTRFFNTPQKTNPGDTTYFAPTDPRYKSMGPKIEGAPSKVTVEGQAGTRMLNGETSPTLDELFTGKAGVGAQGKPTAISGRSMNDIILGALGGVNGAVDRTNPLKPFVDPNFESSVDPAKLQAAKDIAASTMQKTGNLALAGKAFRDTLGIPDGASFGKQGGFFGMGGNYQVIPPAGTAPAAPQPAAAPVIHSATQLPPPAARKVGMTITTPRGDMTWNGQGWVPAAPVN